MSEPENFVSRWSRRKIEAEREKDEPPRPDEMAGPPDPQPPHPADQEARLPEKPEKIEKHDKKDEQTFDISKLPSIESIGAETDVRDFLQKGVPADLTRAALRRAWVADPNIRDFIEIAENQWDFATGKGLPGFGALDASADDIRRMVAEVFGDGPKPAVEAEAKAAPTEAEMSLNEGQSDAAGHPATPPPQQDIARTAEEQSPQGAASNEDAVDVVQRNTVDIAMHQNNPGSEDKPLPARRPHGRALPE
jgi:hypothetical protein